MMADVFEEMFAFMFLMFRRSWRQLQNKKTRFCVRRLFEDRERQGQRNVILGTY